MEETQKFHLVSSFFSFFLAIVESYRRPRSRNRPPQRTAPLPPRSNSCPNFVWLLFVFCLFLSLLFRFVSCLFLHYLSSPNFCFVFFFTSPHPPFHRHFYLGRRGIVFFFVKGKLSLPSFFLSERKILLLLGLRSARVSSSGRCPSCSSVD